MTYPDLEGKTREEGLALLDEWITSDSLKRHCYSVEAAMRTYAERFGEDPDAWGFVGLVHDFDYERHPTLDLIDRGGAGAAGARLSGVGDRRDPQPRRGDWVPRDTKLRKTLSAVDELCGFCRRWLSCGRRSRFATSGVVGQEEAEGSPLRRGGRPRADAGERRGFGVDFDEHIGVVIEELSGSAEALGLAGDGGDAAPAPPV